MKNSIANREGETTCGRPLIVSYSYSGNTHRIAQKIQSATDGDWCEIYPWQPYPMAFPELLEQVKKEVQAHYRAETPAGVLFAAFIFRYFSRYAKLVRNDCAAFGFLVV